MTQQNKPIALVLNLITVFALVGSTSIIWPMLAEPTIRLALLASILAIVTIIIYSPSPTTALQGLFLVSAVFVLASHVGIALLVLIVGTLLGTLIHTLSDARHKKKPTAAGHLRARLIQALWNCAQIIAEVGIGLLAVFVVLLLTQTTLPMIAIELFTVITVLVALFLGLSLSYLIHTLLLPDAEIIAQFQHLPVWIKSGVFVMGILALSLTLTNVGPVVYAAMLLFAIYHITRPAASTVSFKEQMASLETSYHDELTVLKQISRKITGSMLLDDLLLQIYEDIQSVLSFDTFYVATYDETYGTVAFPFVMQQNERQNWEVHALDNGYTSQVIRSGDRVHITLSNQHLYPSLQPNTQERQVAAFAGVPLTIDGEQYGVMAIMHHGNARAFTEKDVLLLETLASQTSVAIRNATVYQQTMMLAQNMSFINTSLHDVMFNIDRAEALQTACEIAASLTHTKKAAIFVNDLEEDIQTAVAYTGFAEGTAPPDWRDMEDTSLDPETTINISDTNQASDAIQRMARISDFRAILGVPLHSGASVIGSLNVYHDTPYQYTASEVSLMEMLANQVAAALDNAELLRALELYASEQAQLVELSRASSVQLELEQIVLKINQVLRDLFHFAKVDVALTLPGRSEDLLLTADVGQEHVTRSYRDLKQIPELTEILASVRFNVVRWDLDNEGLSDALREIMQQVGDVIRIGVPLIINQEVIGILQMRNDTKHTLTGNDIRLLEMATNQISFQLYNARRYNQTEEELVQRLEQLALLEEIAVQIAQSLDTGIILRNVLEAAMRATQATKSTVSLITSSGDLESTIHEMVHNRFTRRTEVQSLEAHPMADVIQTGEYRLQNHLPEPGTADPDDTTIPSAENVRTYQSSLAVPLQHTGKTLGVLEVQSTRPDFFTNEQVGFLKNLASHAAISISNATMLQERQQQVTMLSRLRDMTLSAVETLNQNEIIHVITRESLAVLDGYQSALYYYDPQLDRLIQVTGFIRGKESEIPRVGEPLIPDAAVYKAVHEAETRYIMDTAEDADYQSFRLKDQVQHRSIVIMPIARHHNIQEVLCITFQNPKFFDDEFINTVDLLSLQVARHLEIISLSESLSSSNNQMRIILDASRDGLALLDRNGFVQSANLAAEQLLGIKVDAENRDSFAEILANSLHPEDKDAAEAYAQEVDTIYRTRASSIADREYVIPAEAKPIYIKETHTSVTDDEGRLIARLVTLRDQSEEKELEEYRQKVQSMVIHDLRGPLGSIISSMYLALALLQNDADTVDENLVPSLEVSLESANQLLHLVDSMRDIERMDKGELPLDCQLLPVDYLMEQAVDALSTSMDEANLTIETRIADDITEVYADNDLIRRVLINLLQNAYKFTPSGGRIMIGADHETDEENQVRFFICDTGPGIPADMRERVFEQYEQITTQKPYQGDKGSGLGLHFCKLAVEAHGGRIWVADEGPLSGACFAFTLPLAPD